MIVLSDKAYLGRHLVFHLSKFVPIGNANISALLIKKKMKLIVMIMIYITR